MEKLPYHHGAALAVSALRTAIEPVCDPGDWRRRCRPRTGSMVTLQKVGTGRRARAVCGADEAPISARVVHE